MSPTTLEAIVALGVWTIVLVAWSLHYMWVSSERRIEPMRAVRYRTGNSSEEDSFERWLATAARALFERYNQSM